MEPIISRYTDAIKIRYRGKSVCLLVYNRVQNGKKLTILRFTRPVDKKRFKNFTNSTSQYLLEREHSDYTIFVTIIVMTKISLELLMVMFAYINNYDIDLTNIKLQP